MLHDGAWAGKKTERQIVAARDALIRVAYAGGAVHVISDDTNFEPFHEAALRALAAEHGARFEIQDFTNVPVATCIERDLRRPNSVRHKVINKMYQRYLQPKYTPPLYDPTKDNAIIVDIDGTLAHMTGRSPYDYTRVAEDAVDVTVREIVNAEAARGRVIVLVSGRKASCRDDTLAWLDTHDVFFSELHMRASDDNRDDSIVKREIYDRELAPKYNTLYVLDDRDRVVAMWRSLGLKVLQVAEGDF